MKKEPFYSAFTYCNDLYACELDEDQFETWGMIAWNKIGNADQRLKLMRCVNTECDPEGGFFICKPCDMQEIEAITLPFEDAKSTSSIADHPLTFTWPIEQWIEARKFDPDDLYIPGKFVKFTETLDKIWFTEHFHRLNILYRANIMDDNGLPYLNEKEKFAIAAYCAYCYYKRRGIANKDSGDLQISQQLYKDWQKACDNARTPEYLDQNSAQQILDQMYSYDRHQYGRTSKIVR